MKVSEALLEQKEQLEIVPHLFCLPRAVFLLDINLIKNILLDESNRDSPYFIKIIALCITLLSRRLGFSAFIMKPTEETPYIENYELVKKAITIIRYLINFVDKKANFDFGIFGGVDEKRNAKCIFLLTLICEQDNSEEKLHETLEYLEKYINHINSIDICECSHNTCDMKCNVPDFFDEQYKLLLQIRVVACYFGINLSSPKNPFIVLIRKINHHRVLLKKLEEIEKKEAVYSEFCKALNEENQVDLEKGLSLIDPNDINNLIPDESGRLRSLLYSALKDGGDSIFKILVNYKYINVYLCTDYLQHQQITEHLIDCVTRKELKSNGRLVSNYLIKSRYLSYFLNKTISMDYFQNVLSSLFSELFRCKNSLNEFFRIFEILIKYVDKLKSFSDIAESKNLNSELEKIKKNSFSEYMINELTNDESVIIVYVLILFYPRLNITNENRMTIAKNKLFCLNNLLYVSDFLLVMILKEYLKDENSLLVWDEVYRRCHILNNRVLLKIVEELWSVEYVQTQFLEVTKFDKHVMRNFFIYCRSESNPGLRAVFSEDIIDRVSLFVNPKITHKKLNQQTKSLDIEHQIFVEIENCNFEMINRIISENPDVVSKRNSESLTPLMYCMKIDSLQTDDSNDVSLENIFRLLVDRQMSTSVVCEQFLNKNKVRMGLVHLAIHFKCITYAEILINQGFLNELLDSEGTHLLVYCQNFAGHLGFVCPIIQSILERTPKFDQNLCKQLSERTSALNYDSGLGEEGLCKFRECYISYVEREYQIHSTLLELDMIIFKFGEATTGLDLDSMKDLLLQYQHVNKSNISAKAREWPEVRDYLSLRALFRQPYWIGNSRMLALDFVFFHGRYDIGIWLISLGLYFYEKPFDLLTVHDVHSLTLAFANLYLTIYRASDFKEADEILFFICSMKHQLFKGTIKTILDNIPDSQANISELADEVEDVKKLNRTDFFNNLIQHTVKSNSYIDSELIQADNLDFIIGLNQTLITQIIDTCLGEYNNFYNQIDGMESIKHHYFVLLLRLVRKIRDDKNSSLYAVFHNTLDNTLSYEIFMTYISLSNIHINFYVCLLGSITQFDLKLFSVCIDLALNSILATYQNFIKDTMSQLIDPIIRDIDVAMELDDVVISKLSLLINIDNTLYEEIITLCKDRIEHSNSDHVRDYSKFVLFSLETMHNSQRQSNISSTNDRSIIEQEKLNNN